MREINDHKVGKVNEALRVATYDSGLGENETSKLYTIVGASAGDLRIHFQIGNPDEVGITGITSEALLAIVCDQLRQFQRTKFSCKENACALTHIEEAMHWLQSRTLARQRKREV